MDYRFGPVTVACTNVDRVMFPTDGITKGDLLAYYHDVAPLMVPELSGRPLSVVRYTKGIDRGGFFQKHYQKHFPTWLDRVTAGSKTRVDYPIVDTAAGLVYMANQGAIEFHVWTSRADPPSTGDTGQASAAARDAARPSEAPRGLDRPDTLVVDLDPPDGQFDLARRAALAVRELLTQLDLPAFVKTTGSKGLHVVAPLDDSAGFDEVGGLAVRIGALLCRRHPELLTMEFYKKDRKGRLFLDVLRNALGATFVAPYSVRGKPGAPISAPLAWAELDDPALRADAIQLRSMRARLDHRGDPWQAFRRVPGSVASASRALAALAD